MFTCFPFPRFTDILYIGEKIQISTFNRYPLVFTSVVKQSPNSKVVAASLLQGYELRCFFASSLLLSFLLCFRLLHLTLHPSFLPLPLVAFFLSIPSSFIIYSSFRSSILLSSILFPGTLGEDVSRSPVRFLT